MHSPVAKIQSDEGPLLLDLSPRRATACPRAVPRCTAYAAFPERRAFQIPRIRCDGR